MSFNPPEGILDIGNATLRVGKLEVAETTGLNQGLQNIVKNDLLITEKETYLADKTWGIKLPTAWVGEFDLKTHDNKYVEFNFYNEGSTSNALGYTLNFKDTTLTLKYDNGNTLASETIPDVSTSTYKKVNVFFERGVIAVFIDGARVLYFKESDTYNSVHGHPGMASRVASTTGGSFVNIFIEADGSDSAVKDLRIVNGRFISDKTSNVSFIGSLGVGVHSPQESLDIRGNMHLTRVSNVSQVSVDSNVVTEYTGPHDRPLRKYPEVALSITSESASGENGYKVSWSSIYDNGNNVNERPFRAFDGDIGNTGNAWMVPSGVYGSDGTYAQNPPRNLGTATGGNSTTVDGEYIILQTPNKIKVKHFRISDKSTFTGRAAEAGKLYGSNDGSTWYELASFSELIYYDGDYFNTVHVNATTYYDRLALVVTNSTATSSSTYMGIGELEYYGYEEGSGSLDTTLKSVYNVPATTGTQLEVYYDGRETSSYSGSGTTVTDISPNTNNGTLNGGVGFDSTYKAFTFDGNGDYIRTSTLPSVFENDPNLTQSVWVYFNELSFTRSSGTDFNSVLVINASGQYNIGTINELGVGPDGIVYHSSGARGIKTSNPIISDSWYHITVTKTPGNTGNETQKIYINGVLVPQVPWNASGTQVIGANPFLTIGGSGQSTPDQQVKGSIANVRLYSKVLNAGQVQELYDYQKDYFLGSKSQVTLYKGHLGVGVTEPSGQLELAGDERIQEYPPRALTGYSTHIEGHGVFGLHHNTGTGAAGAVVNAFNKSTAVGDFWYSTIQVWSPGGQNVAGPFNYVGTHSIAGISGEWVYITLPYHVNMKYLQITARNGEAGSAPNSAIIIGSSDGGTTWEQIGNWSDKTSANFWLDGGVPSPAFTINSTKPLNAVGFVVTEANYYYAFTIGEIKFFGTPGPTTLDKGSLSLTRSLDVPRVSRYDVDTETPRPDDLVCDYATNTNQFHDAGVNIRGPIDHSGKNNHMRAFNTPHDGVMKALRFDGSSSYTHAPLPTPFHGDPTVTMSAWVFPSSLATTSGDWDTIIHLGKNVSGQQVQLSYNATAGHLSIQGYDQSMRTNNINAMPAKKWTHICAVIEPGAWSTANKKLYINGEFYPTVLTGSGTTSLPAGPADTTSQINIGSVKSTGSGYIHFFNGWISSVKLWDKALTPAEVKKIYNMGRLGRSMVIADTAVGIGKTPQTELDVRGSARITGNMIVGGNMNYNQYWFWGDRNGQTSGQVIGSSLVIQYNQTAGYTGAWTSSNTWNCPVPGVWMVMGSLMAYPHSNQGYFWVEVRRYNGAGQLQSGGSANDMHSPYRDSVYQSWQFKQSHHCQAGDKLQVWFRASGTDASMNLHGSWGNINIFKIG